ncbi:MAG: glycoside hydrolase family 32 protein [Cyclobacteriaceae bacterium]|nr:glycoside hydrolase family 32 protein [Cyclobacteriaceae bacterium]
MRLLQNLFLIALLTTVISCSKKEPETATIIEPHRPQFHFSPPAKWMNDPNGMVYYNGEYHLFYQHYPDSTMWGPMHWGHAVSKDLIHWEHLPIALYPDSLGYIFSGSAVVDANNTAGFQSGNEKPLVAIFTYDKQGYETQAIAFSNDKGHTWTKYENNPVIKNPGEKDFRDPKVFWHVESEHWIMSLAVANRIQFFRSKNLKDWELTGEFGREHGNHGGVWECPDLFQLPVTGTTETRWVLLVSINPGSPNGGSGTQYFIGNFDGKTFTSEHGPSTERFIDYGRDNYAGVTWGNAPDGRTIFLGWMSNWNYAQVVPTETWRSAMTLPRDLSLHNTSAGIRLVSTPSKEVEQLRTERKDITVDQPFIHTGLAEVKVEFDLNETAAKDFGIELFNSKNENIRIGYDRESNWFYIDRTNPGKKEFSTDFVGIQYAPRFSDSHILTLHIFVDVASVELFADGGVSCMTAIFFPTEDFTQLKIYGDGEVKLLSTEAYELKSIW